MNYKTFFVAFIAFSILTGCVEENGTKMPKVNSSISTSQTNYAPWNDSKSSLYKKSIYFGFDDFLLDTEGLKTTVIHAAFLATHPNVKVCIEGNADERGTLEYNQELAKKRANAVRERMLLSGVSASQIEVVSLGKEHPKNSNHDKDAWDENRRVDIVYKNYKQ